MKFKDVQGDELEIEELIGRLVWRNQRKTGIKPDENLNLSICWRRHVSQGIEIEKCKECDSTMRYRIKAGVLFHGLTDTLARV